MMISGRGRRSICEIFASFTRHGGIKGIFFFLWRNFFFFCSNKKKEIKGERREEVKGIGKKEKEGVEEDGDHIMALASRHAMGPYELLSVHLFPLLSFLFSFF